MGKKKNAQQTDIDLENYLRGYRIVEQHPMFSSLLAHVHAIRSKDMLYFIFYSTVSCDILRSIYSFLINDHAVLGSPNCG